MGSAEFAARPLRKFYDLRGEIIQRMAQYANVRARYKEEPAYSSVVSEDLTLSQAELDRLGEAQDTIRDLAARMRSFALNETFASWVLSFRYNPLRASEGLFGASNSMDTYGAAKANSKKIVADALRIPENIL